MNRIDLTGNRFGRLVAQSFAYTSPKDGLAYWTCLCDCGKTCEKRTKTLRNGTATSCGCYHRERAKEANTTHGLGSRRSEAGEHPIYRAWMALRRRCDYTKGNRYSSYGGRGITYDPRWATFEAFRDDMLPTWKQGLTLERKDVNGNYCKDNCTWITHSEQMKNMRKTIRLEFKGKTQSVEEWSKETGIDYGTITYRLRAGWPVAKALTKPSQLK